MSGRPYTLVEMKGIVDYIVERCLYSEYKGRKMWQDYAGSKMTTRSWQSLKEAFIKRILPDIHNPFYKLNLDQIRSFRCGYDIKLKENEGKLEFRSASSIRKPSKRLSQTNGDDTPGEPQSSQLVTKRESSTDTIVLGTDKCVEIIDSDDEPRAKETYKESSCSPSKKSIRDCITYSEPLTPMLQEILHDFDSEDEEEDVKKVFDTELEIIEHGIDIEPDEVETQIQEEPNKEPVLEDNNSKENINTENSTEEFKTAKKNKKTTKKSEKKATMKAVSENEIEDKTGNSSEEFEKSKKSKKSSKKNLSKRTFKKAQSDGEGPNDTTDIRVTRSNQLTQIDEKDNTETEAKETAPTTSNITQLEKTSEQNLTNKSIVATAGSARGSMPDSLLPNNQEELSEDTTKRQTRSSSEQDKSQAVKTPSKSTEPSQIIDTKSKLKSESDTDNKKNKTNSQDKHNETEEEWDCHKYNDKDYADSSNQTKEDNNIPTTIDDAVKTKKQKQSENTKNKQDNNKGNKPVDPAQTLNVESSQQRKKNSPKLDKKENQTNSKQSTENIKTTSWSIRENQPEGLKLILEKQLGSSPSILESPSNSQDLYSESELESSQLIQNQKEFSPPLSDKEESANPNTKKQLETSKSENQAKTSETDAENLINKPKLNIDEAGTSKAADNQPSTSKTTKDDQIVPKETKKNDSRKSIETYSKPTPDAIQEISDTPTDESEKPKKRKMAALINGLFSNRKDGINRKRGRTRRYDNDDSSSWTSDSDDDIFDSLPSRRRRNSKYAKSKRILIDENGNAFFAVGRRLEPMKKQPVDNSSQDFWKQKFLEEQMRNADLIKLLSRISETNKYDRIEENPKTANSRPIEAPQANEPTATSNGQVQNSEKPQAKTVSIKFAKNNQELKIEGEWQNLQCLLPEMMQMLQKTEKIEANTKDGQIEVKNDKLDTKQKENAEQNGVKKVNKVYESDKESAITVAQSDDEEVHEKINKLEEEILKETLQKETSINTRKSTESVLSITSSVDDNASSRPKRGRKKQPSVEPQPVQSKEGPAKRIRGNASDGDVNVSKRKKKTDAVNSDTGKRQAAIKKSPASKKTSPTKQNETPLTVIEENESEEILYKFPSPVLDKKRSTSSSRPKRQKVAEKTTELQLNFIPEQSMESTQGYLDSDCSSFTVINLRRKKKLGLATNPHRIRQSRYFKRKSSNTYMEDTSESSNSCFNIPAIKINGKARKRRSSSVNSSRCKTDSYQLIMAQRNEINRLSNGENTNTRNTIREMLNLSPASQNLEGSIEIRNMNSSSVSLPASPELSIVDNISIESNCLQKIFEQPSFNNIEEMEVSSVTETASLNKVEASLPLMLMTQDCNSNIDGEETNNNLSQSTAITMKDLQLLIYSEENEQMSIDTNVHSQIANTELTADESLHVKLSNMLLESAKKMTKKPLNPDKENNPPITKENKTKKRCSTPRKKRTIKKLSKPNVDAIIEEHVDCCSSGRKSAPPKLYTEEIRIQENSITLPESSFTTKPNRTRKTKEVVKVKISRPKRSSSRLSVMTDSGINDNSLYDDNASVDLIHNHSETCIANDCMSDSCQIIDRTVSVISITSNSNQSSDQTSSPIFFSAYSMDGSMKHDALLSKSTNPTISPRMQSMASPNSLITEDLSDQDTKNVRPDWYFYTEDGTNTNLKLLKPLDCTMGSNLNQIFPIICAVPDLSTITEHTEAENTKNNYSNFTANSDSKTY